MKKKIFKFILIFIFIVVLGVVSFRLYNQVAKKIANSREYDENHWKEFTNPLPNEVKEDLCEKFDLPEDNRLCDPNLDIYGGEFYPLFEERFDPFGENPADYDSVMSYIGNYLTDCTEPMEDSIGTEIINCTFDLRGDGRFTILFMFEPSDKLYAIRYDLIDF